MKKWWPLIGWALFFAFWAIVGIGVAYGFLGWAGCLEGRRPTEKCSWTAAALPFLTGPVLFGIWMMRFQHKRADIQAWQAQNQLESEKETRRVFERLQERAALWENRIYRHLP